MAEHNRCSWAKDPANIEYHDREWGRPVHDDRVLFEFLILEGMQAGLGWITILKKRENFRSAFDGFDPVKISKYTQVKIDELLLNPGIIRNKLKVNAAIANAKAFLAVQKEFGSFDKYIWSFVDGKSIINKRQSLSELPAKTEISDKMSKDLKKKGFSFVGSTICYAFMQAVGMVNDHLVSCDFYNQRW
jgi:DNA-3-methyladenine glycosylase I